MTDQAFNIQVETENGNYIGAASHVLVLLTNYFADKKIFEEDVVENDHIEYIKARHIKISSDIELETDVDGDKSDDLPVEIKVLGQHIQVYSQPKE